MRVHITRDERYPVYELVERNAAVLDVDDETSERWARAQRDWEQMQTEVERHLAAEPRYYDADRSTWHI